MLHIREYDFITESTVFLSHASISVRWYQVHLRGWPSPSGVLKHQLYAYPHPSLSLEAKWRKLRCSQNSPWPLILFSMISDAANKAIWRPVSSHLVFELPAIDFLNMSGIFVETIWKHKDLLQGMRDGSPWGHLHLFTFTQMLFPCLLPLQWQVPVLSSVLLLFSHVDSGLELRWTSGRFHCSPHSYLCLHRESYAPFCSSFLGYPSSSSPQPPSRQTQSLAKIFPVLLWERK